MDWFYYSNNTHVVLLISTGKLFAGFDQPSIQLLSLILTFTGLIHDSRCYWQLIITSVYKSVRKIQYCKLDCVLSSSPYPLMDSDRLRGGICPRPILFFFLSEKVII